uniref:Uncharacterized protein n=1 Tax=Micrurus corallinus TaxID=54390 RepID=A0A2D4GP34_MICCO
MEKEIQPFSISSHCSPHNPSHEHQAPNDAAKSQPVPPSNISVSSPSFVNLSTNPLFLTLYSSCNVAYTTYHNYSSLRSPLVCELSLLSHSVSLSHSFSEVHLGATGGTAGISKIYCDKRLSLFVLDHGLQK